MSVNTLQAPRTVVMVRPHAFLSNPETVEDNAFQKEAPGSECEIAAKALEEFDEAVSRLRKHGITVHVFEDEGERETPDSVFPNNWFSTHPGGQVGIYPMFTRSRRRERRRDVIDLLKTRYRVETVHDYSGLEQDDLALEGTGAMVLDHIGRLAYVARSNRANPIALERFCTHFSYEPLVFNAADSEGCTIYHTNVLMCIATDFALIGLSMIQDPKRRATVLYRLGETGRDVIELTEDQIAAFAGNAIELTGDDGHVLVLSETAHKSLSADQIARIEVHAKILPIRVPTIQYGGGSARCMIAGIHLTARPKEADLT